MKELSHNPDPHGSRDFNDADDSREFAGVVVILGLGVLGSSVGLFSYLTILESELPDVNFLPIEEFGGLTLMEVARVGCVIGALITGVALAFCIRLSRGIRYDRNDP